MDIKKPVSNERRAARLHAIARGYVTEGLGKKNFEAIPYSENVVLRAPIAPGGSTNPLSGRETVRATWWAPLPDLVDEVEVVDSYVNEALSAVTVEFYCTLSHPACTLRIVDRFIVNEDGEITGQENFFDPRDISHPGWREE
ncbi:MAG: nuclear transport factor 2 family protein [Rhodothermaceae bacterium]|nr:nuclear transport factor 2 family protein [Rhodothermaceae bacterium]